MYYKVVNRKDPRNPEGAGKFYAQAISLGIIESETIAKTVAARSGHSFGQVLGLFQDYFRRVEQYVLQGNTVAIDPIGTLIPVFNGVGATTPEEFDTSCIQKVRCYLRQSKKLKRNFSLLYRTCPVVNWEHFCKVKFAENNP